MVLGALPVAVLPHGRAALARCHWAAWARSDHGPSEARAALHRLRSQGRHDHNSIPRALRSSGADFANRPGSRLGCEGVSFARALTRRGLHWLKGASLDAGRIPTIEFDVSLVTDAVKAEIRHRVAEIEGSTALQRDAIYDAALRSVSAGRDLHTLYAALIELGIEGMTKSNARTIAMRINNRATSLMNRTRQQSLGIEQARWRYSGAPCMTNPKKATPKDIEQDKAHKAADRQCFKVSQGMFLNGKWTWPGDEDGCRCVSISIIPGLD